MIFLIAWKGLESDSLLGQAAASFLSLAASGRYVASRPWAVVYPPKPGGLTEKKGDFVGFLWSNMMI